MPRLIALASLLVCLPLLAGPVELQLVDAKQQGELLELTRGKLSLQTASGIVQLPVGALSARDAAAASAAGEALAGKDAERWLELAAARLSWRLTGPAQAAFRQAAALDSSFVIQQAATEGERESRAVAARLLFARGYRLRQAGKLSEARAAYNQLIAEHPASPQADAVARELATMGSDSTAPEPPKTKADKRLDTIRLKLRGLEERRVAGLTHEADGDDKRAAAEWSAGLSLLDAIERALEKLLRDKAVASQIPALQRECKGWRVRFHLLLGELAARKRQFKDALSNANKALIADKDNEDAEALRKAVMEAKLSGGSSLPAGSSELIKRGLKKLKERDSD